MFISIENGNPDRNAQSYGRSIAHEIGNVTTLGHRTASDSFSDGLDKPEDKNLMDDPTAEEDFDLIQVKAMRGKRWDNNEHFEFFKRRKRQ